MSLDGTIAPIPIELSSFVLDFRSENERERDVSLVAAAVVTVEATAVAVAAAAGSACSLEFPFFTNDRSEEIFDRIEVRGD